VAGGLGFLYELQVGPTYETTRFLLDIGVGAQGGMTAFLQSGSMKLEKQGTDLDGEAFTYVYEINDRHDKYNNLAVQVPLMIGVQHKKFYMLAGVKLQANVLTKAHTTANITTYGQYEKIPDLRDMPDYQFFTDHPISKSADASLNLDLDASFEIGGRIGVVNEAVGYDVPKRKIEMRLGAFLDYGLLDVHTSRTLEGFNTDAAYVNDPGYIYQQTTMIDNLEMNDIMSTTDFAKSVNNLMIGLKFTVLFQLPEPGECVICRDAYRSSARPRNGRLKYEE